MKIKQQVFASIISLIILTFFVGAAQAYVCDGNYTIDDVDTSGDIAALSGCTAIRGGLFIRDTTTLTNLNGLENLTIITNRLVIANNNSLVDISALSNITEIQDYLYIYYNDALTNLDGLDSLTRVSEEVWIYNNASLTSLCGLYNLSYFLEFWLYNNTNLSMDTAYGLETQLINNGATGRIVIVTNNGTGRVICEIDNDNDGVFDEEDNCPGTYNPDQRDSDSDTIGDRCDNCRYIENHNQLDSDYDGDGDLCDACPNDRLNDSDNDGVCESIDNCPNISNSNQEDTDNDSIGDLCDNCPNFSNPDQEDADNDGAGNICDNCPNISNLNQGDADNDSTGDMCDEDTIYGTITGDIQEGITSSIYVFSCGEPQPHSTVTTDSQGYYAIGGLEDGRYLIGASYAGYSFSKSLWVDIPCLLPESYDFISSLITYEISGKITGEVQEGVTLTLSGDDDATAISTENGTYSFIDLVPGTYTITASMTNFTFEPVSEVVQLVDSDTTSVDFTAIFQPPRFIDNDDGTVTDTATNLTWLKNANCYGSQTWTTALSLAGNLYEGECDLWEWPEGDWRLPTKEELQGIGTDPPATWDTEYPSVTWTMPGEPFINVRPGPYWSSNTYDSNHAWAVEMHDGSSFSRDKDYADYVWPVRSDPIEAVWEYDIGSDVDHSPAVAGEYVYVGNNYGMVFCLNAATGVKVWEYANGSDALAVSGGYVYVGDYDYKVLCLNADNGTIVWEYTIVGNLRSSPTVSGDYVYLSTGVKVYCLNVATGAKIWESAIEANDSPAVSGSYVYVRRGDGKIYCLDAATGAFVWEYEILTYSDTSPVVSSGYVYVGSWGDPVFCLNAVNGFKNMGIYPI